MRRLGSLQARLGLTLGVALTALWLAAGSLTAVILRGEMNQVFDAALKETSDRILPLAVVDIIARAEAEEPGVQRLATAREGDEFFTYILRDETGAVLMQSHNAEPTAFPAWQGAGFSEDATYRFYSDFALQGTVRITVAEPLAHRAEVAREIEMGLLAPLLIVLPLALAAVALGVRLSLGAVRRFRAALSARGPRDFSPLPVAGLPAEIAPLASALNGVLARLEAAFEAERSFAANAAHELRTPLAGAIAQAQRLRAETADPAAAARAGEIEAVLKRLTRFAERLMQLARAEGGRIRRAEAADLRPVLRLVAEDVARAGGAGRVTLDLPRAPVLGDIDPDALAILARNLLENAWRHGAAGAQVGLALTPAGVLRVTNDGAPVPPEMLARLTARFERGGAQAEGAGLGLAIVAAIAEGAGGRLTLSSPIPGAEGGFCAEVRLPVQTA